MITPAKPASQLLTFGDVAPWFKAPALDGSPTYSFDTTAGRHILMLFFGTASIAESAAAIAQVMERRALFDDHRACFFGITVDPTDVAENRIAQSLPGIRYFLDYSREVSRLYGADAGDGRGAYAPHWLLLDGTLRVVKRYHLQNAAEALAAIEALSARPSQPDWAPVLMVPNVLEPDVCRQLIALYERNGGSESGFMREIDGKTVLVTDPHHKLRRDYNIEDPALQKQLSGRIVRRLLPMVKRAFQFEATRMERYLVGCYDAQTGGHFRPHRDNTTKGTAHRRFAVTINLNSDEYDGGDLHFPEFGHRTYRAPTGGAVVFSCSMLHEATPVTRGRRYAFLPFLYDEAAAEIRERNNPHLDASVGAYRRA